MAFTRTKKGGEKAPKKLGVKLGDKLGVKLGENEIKILKLMER